MNTLPQVVFIDFWQKLRRRRPRNGTASWRNNLATAGDKRHSSVRGQGYGEDQTGMPPSLIGHTRTSPIRDCGPSKAFWQVGSSASRAQVAATRTGCARPRLCVPMTGRSACASCGRSSHGTDGRGLGPVLWRPSLGPYSSRPLLAVPE